jgi:hypothetical protein
MSKSCVGCKFLYGQGVGYSNYTWEDTEVHCAKDRNPHLPQSEPYDWKREPEADNWDKTKESRCALYAPGEYVTLDVDGEDGPADSSTDQEQIDAIVKHSGRPANGH